jgi:hypothetical protein
MAGRKKGANHSTVPTICRLKRRSGGSRNGVIAQCNSAVGRAGRLDNQPVDDQGGVVGAHLSPLPGRCGCGGTGWWGRSGP